MGGIAIFRQPHKPFTTVNNSLLYFNTCKRWEKLQIKPDVALLTISYKVTTILQQELVPTCRKVTNIVDMTVTVTKVKPT